MKTSMLIVAYLAAIVAANLLVAAFGPAVVIVNAFVLIAFDLASRDALHDAWRGRQLWLRMAGLIAAGSLLSWLLNVGAGPVALASFLAFALSGAADAVTYHLLRDRARLIRMNGSNVVSGLIDSIVFLGLLATFGGLPWGAVPVLVFGQWLAKVAGGALWSVVLTRREMRAI
jgi:queuosine precursor transporter